MGSIVNVALIIMLIISTDSKIMTKMFTDVLLILITIVLFFITKKKVKRLILSRIKSEAQTKRLLDELQNNIDIIRTNTSALNNDISKGNENLSIIRDISSSITAATQEITTGIVDQNKSVVQINQMIKKQIKISELTEFSDQLENVSQSASNVVTEIRED